MQFSDSEHRNVPLTLHSIDELAYEQCCDEEVLACVDRWRNREDSHAADMEKFQIDGVKCFAISYQGVSGNFWPSKDSNFIEESLIREFLYHDGICSLKDLDIKLYCVSYTAVAMQDEEYLLVCPFNTAEGNIGGLVVVCVNKHMKK